VVKEKGRGRGKREKCFYGKTAKPGTGAQANRAGPKNALRKMENEEPEF